ncbi:MAG: TetR/AcrR family transcriptional regulator [Chloroflexi bacterium]|nr:TetR/AcrR family transcriptional regulator [Chloroflexota bacterium]
MTMTMTRITENKEHIIAAAVRLWQQAHNVNKVSLADIAREAGVSPTTVYNNFGTREGLVEEVIKHLLAEILGKQKAILNSDLPFPAKVQNMISVKMKATRGIQVDLLDKICTDTSAKEYVKQMTETEAKPMMRALIGEGKREGYIRADLPDEVIMLYFDILQSGSATCTEEMRRVVGDKRLTAALTRLIYFGLFQKEFDLPFNESAEKES